ncbi:MAG: nucleotide exchange factor GrpE [Spirochaetia bacterium]|jgi:molecular chaperone GrpE
MSKKKDQEEVSGGAQNVHAAEPPAHKSESPQKGEPAAAGGLTGTGASAESPCVSEQDRIAALEKETADLKDRLLRKQADFENFRKRMIREREDAARYANASLLTDVIGLIDDFERAIKSAEESRDFASFLQGVTMIEKQLVEMLESRWGLKRFASVGEGFDPNKHEAVLRVEGPADGKPTVVEDYQKGYYLHERVLRPARVKVRVPASEPAAQAPQGPKMPPAGKASPGVTASPGAKADEGGDGPKEGQDGPVGRGN